MNSQYNSKITPLFASEDLAFDLQLMQRGNVQKLSGYDILVEVYTCQLSPRKSVMSIISDPSLQKDTVGAEVIRYSSHFILRLKPEFLKCLPTGVLTFSIRYRTDKMVITNVITTGRFLNDCPANSDLLVE